MIAALAETSPPLIQPLLIIVLCAVAAIGTVLLLPQRREGAIRKMGGSLVLVAAALGAAMLVRVAAGQADPMGVYFWVFSGLALFGALRVITHRRPVYSALYFILTVFASAGLFVLLWAEFLAVALILIYAGAIMVTYVFVIMLAGRSGDGSDVTEADGSRDPAIASAVGFCLMAILLFVIFDKAPQALTPATSPGNTDITVRGLALYLFQSQLVNLELAGVLLTLSMVGSIIIARRRLWTPGTQPIEDALDYRLGDDDPHSIAVAGSTNPRQKAYPEH